MRSILDFLSSNHRHCDDSLAHLEKFVTEKKWSEALTAFNEFNHDMRVHFEREESVLFPAFEETTAMTCGPTQVMRMEHEQMREILNNLPDAIDEKNFDRVLGMTETLMILIQQHNSKEEQILYTMCDMHLSDQLEILISKMSDLK